MLEQPISSFGGLDYDSFKFGVSNIIMKFIIQKKDPSGFTNLNSLHFIQNYYSSFEAEVNRTCSVLENEQKNASSLDPIESILSASVSLFVLGDKNPFMSVSGEKKKFEKAVETAREYFNRFVDFFFFFSNYSFQFSQKYLQNSCNVSQSLEN